MKKILAITLAIVMMLSLGACGKFESQMANAMTNLKDANSFSADIAVNVKANVKVEDAEMPIALTCKAKTDVFSEPYRSHLAMDIFALGEQMGEGEFYFVRGDNDVTAYSRVEGEDWDVKSVEMADVTMPTFSVDQILALAKITETFDETQESKKADNGTTTYSGVITGEDVQKFLEIMSMESMSEQMMDAAAEGLELDLAQLGNIPTTIVVDNETNTFSQFVFDLTEWMQSALSISAEQEDVETPVDITDMNVTVAAASMVINIKNYNNAPAFEVPQLDICGEPADEGKVAEVEEVAEVDAEIEDGAGDEDINIEATDAEEPDGEEIVVAIVPMPPV